ncbi:MAG TPA: GDSL-type esterase/lipase family protein [Acetobacteraceae bacterium]|nr:GDSL-type esterase/lipase family protein [Acetobacteraceae bacterium]
MRRLPTIFVLFALLCAAAGPVAHARTILAAVPISRMDLHWWRERFDAKQAALRDRHPALVFYGDSITEDWERHGPPAWKDFAPVWQRFYGDRNAVNLGFVGDTTASLIWRIGHGEATGIAPKVAVILIGANNLGHLHWSTGDTVLGIDTIVRDLRRRLPTTKLLLLGILPSDRSAWATETTLAVNRILARHYPRGGAVTFLDVGHVFMRGKKLDRNLFLDPRERPPEAPLHPTARGQALMAAAMEPTLAALLGDRVHQ